MASLPHHRMLVTTIIDGVIDVLREKRINEIADRIQIRDNRFFVEDSIENILFRIHDDTRGRTADDVNANLEQLQNTFIENIINIPIDPNLDIDNQELKDSIVEKINQILNQDNFHTWYYDIKKLLDLNLNQVLDTNFENWYHPLVNLGQNNSQYLNANNMQFQEDLARIYQMGNVRVDQNQINLHDNVRLFEFYKNNQKMPKYNVEQGESDEVNYFYIKQYFERFLQNELQGNLDLSSVITKMRQIPIGRVEFEGEAGMDYGGLRVSFFDELMKNFKNSFLANSEKQSYLKEYIEKKELIESYDEPELSKG